MQEYLILIDDVDFNKNKLREDLSRITGFNIKIFKNIFDGGTSPFNWTNSMNHMRELSKLYPERVITLQYIGDKVSSTYREYYLNGQVQVVPVRMSFDSFNPEFLS